jgi:hypothetical protein
MNLFENGLRVLDAKSKKWFMNDSSIGIVTAADENVFRGLQALFTSVKNKINFLCYDLGLTAEQKKWCTENNLPLKDLSFLESFLKVRAELVKTEQRWFSYVKPWVVCDSPFEYTIWLDTDCIVVGDLTQAELIVNKQTFFVENFCTICTKNLPYLYEQHPVEADLSTWKPVNAGVFGVCKKDIQELVIDKWQYLIGLCAQDPKLKKTCDFYWDEGMLNWALQKNNSLDLITHSFLYNWPGDCILAEKTIKDKRNNVPSVFAPINLGPSLFFLNLLKNSEDKFVVHFASGDVREAPKYFSWWN